MSEPADASPPPPALRVQDLVVREEVDDDAPATPHARDLPDIARFLFHALGAARDEPVRVIDRVSFTLPAGGTLALVGEDGSGKSTLARAFARLKKPDQGVIEVAGLDATRNALSVRRNLQVIFDDHEAGLDPRITIADSLTLADDAFRLPKADRAKRFAAVLARAQLDPLILPRRASSLPFGERKRVALARALLPEPAVVVVDEPASGLDPTERAALFASLTALRAAAKTALLVLTKDLAAARTLGDRIGVLHRGALIETAAADALFAAPVHEYTKSLVSAAPRLRR